jgi:hypothetical protein
VSAAPGPLGHPPPASPQAPARTPRALPSGWAHGACGDPWEVSVSRSLGDMRVPCIPTRVPLPCRLACPAFPRALTPPGVRGTTAPSEAGQSLSSSEDPLMPWSLPGSSKAEELGVLRSQGTLALRGPAVGAVAVRSVIPQALPERFCGRLPR